MDIIIAFAALVVLILALGPHHRRTSGTICHCYAKIASRISSRLSSHILTTDAGVWSSYAPSKPDTSLAIEKNRRVIMFQTLGQDINKWD